MRTIKISDDPRNIREALDGITDDLLAGRHSAHYIRMERGMVFIDIIPRVIRKSHPVQRITRRFEK